MMDKIILTDCDGCIVDWNAGFNKFMTSKGLPQLPDTDNEYSISIRHGITVKAGMFFVKEFNESCAIAKLDPFADSVKYVAKLASKGFKFIVVTSISDAPQAKVYRTENLTNIFGDVFNEINCIEMGASKANILTTKWGGSGYFWIEDHMRQAEAGHEAGLKTILISHPYNTHYKTDLFPKVSYKNPWRDIYKIVCKEYNIKP